MFHKFKLKVGHRKLRKSLRGVTRNRLVYNLDSARYVGILFNATAKDMYNPIRAFSNELEGRGINVEMLAFYGGKELPASYISNKKMHFFTKKELNWYKKPKDPAVDEFVEKEFDILIDLSMEEVFPLQWIATLSRAKFKVGNLSYYGTPNDLIINIKPSEDIEYLLSQVKHYLELINNKFAQAENSK